MAVDKWHKKTYTEGAKDMHASNASATVNGFFVARNTTPFFDEKGWIQGHLNGLPVTMEALACYLESTLFRYPTIGA